MARMNRPAPVEITYKNMRFLITHNPTNVTLNKFIEELKKYGVSTVVRVCEATYDSTLVVKEGIQVLLCQKPLCQVYFLGCRPELSNMADHLAHAQYRPGRGTDRVVTCTRANVHRFLAP